LRTNLRVTGVVAAGAIVASVPWVGWHTLIAPVIAGAVFNVIQSTVTRWDRPEYPLAIGWLLFQIAIAVGFAMAASRPVFALPLFVLMVIGSGAMFPVRIVFAGLAATAVLVTLTALHLNAHAVLHNPAFVALPLALLGSVGLIGWAVQQSAIYHRSTRIVDPLTGLLNRAALDARTAELAHQSELTGEQISVLIGDLDGFKAVNDSFGHAKGDEVLVEVAERIRRHVRAFESVFRFGGDEVTVLVAGVGTDGAADLARRLGDAVRDSPVCGCEITMSFGIAASMPGDPFDFDEVFRRADAALYAAKRDGGDGVKVAGFARLYAVAAA
jgi:diguanylate cyclase (GGDEF)-like protein